MAKLNRYRDPLACLDEVERTLAPRGPLTLQEIADILGVSKQRVAQIEAVAMGKLRDRARDVL